MSVDSMYMDNILDHYKDPQNKGIIENPDIDNEEKNPSCGDKIRVTATINKKEELQEIMFDGTGCAISQAAISMLTDELKGKTMEEVMRIQKKDVLELLGVDVVPMRIKCAMLGLRVLQRGILKYKGKNTEEISLSEI